MLFSNWFGTFEAKEDRTIKKSLEEIIGKTEDDLYLTEDEVNTRL